MSIVRGVSMSVGGVGMGQLLMDATWPSLVDLAAGLGRNRSPTYASDLLLLGIELIFCSNYVGLSSILLDLPLLLPSAFTCHACWCPNRAYCGSLASFRRGASPRSNVESRYISVC